jgi:hypothetical protein
MSRVVQNATAQIAHNRVEQPQATAFAPRGHPPQVATEQLGVKAAAGARDGQILNHTGYRSQRPRAVTGAICAPRAGSLIPTRLQGQKGGRACRTKSSSSKMRS